MPQFTTEEAGVEEMEDEDVDVGYSTPVISDEFWESQHPNSPMFTPLQQIPQSPTQTVHMGSKETHPTASVHEEITVTSAEETAAAEHVKTQTATKEEPEIPQPEEPAIEIPEAVMLHITGDAEDVNSWVLDWMSENTHYKAPTTELLRALPLSPPLEGACCVYNEPELTDHASADEAFEARSDLKNKIPCEGIVVCASDCLSHSDEDIESNQGPRLK